MVNYYKVCALILKNIYTEGYCLMYVRCRSGLPRWIAAVRCRHNGMWGLGNLLKPLLYTLKILSQKSYYSYQSQSRLCPQRGIIYKYLDSNG